MISLVVGTIFLIAAVVLFFLNFKETIIQKLQKIVSPVIAFVGILLALSGSVSYNDAGYCQHVRTVAGTESSTCATGWYFIGWGASTQWPHFITVANSADDTDAGSAVSGPYPVRLADNWNGTVTQSTRFGIPQDNEQFIKMARDFRSPERLITTTLRAAVRSALDSTSNLYSMEEYYAGGKRDEFKTEYRDALLKGRAQVRQVTSTRALPQQRGAVPNSLDSSQDTSSPGDTEVRRTVMEKVLVNGEEVREPHAYMEYGITVSSAILENLDPDDRFEEQIQARKDAASRRIVAQEERKEQEEQRLLAIQTGKTDVAKRQAEAQVEQIEKTTKADTDKKLALIKASQQKEQAQVAAETAEINLRKAEIDAKAKQVAADAAAYEKRVVLEADNALAQKLDAWVEINRAWASSASSINVPETVFNMGGSGSDGANTGNYSSVQEFMTLMSAAAAQQLNVDTSIVTGSEAQ